MAETKEVTHINLAIPKEPEGDKSYEVYVCGSKKVLNKEQFHKYIQLTEDVSRLANGRNEDMIHPEDAYFKKKEELDKFCRYI